MALDVPMPKLGLTMEEATIIEWLVDDGAQVDGEQPIMLIETDKTETEVGSPGGGRLHQIGRPGDTFACGERVALILAEGEAAPVDAAPAPTTGGAEASAVARNATTRVPDDWAQPASATGRLMASPNARRIAAERGVQLRGVRGTGPGGRIVSEDVLVAPSDTSSTPAPSRPAVATVAARQLADLLGVDLAHVPVDPAERRITREGVALYVRSLLGRLAPPSPTAEQPAPSAASAPLLQEPTETLRLTGMRGTIARRMHASLQEMAQLTLTMDADMAAVLADRTKRKATDANTPSITDYVVAATARALLVHPRFNAQITGAGIALLPDVHVGLAVAVENGLLVPVIRHTARHQLAALAAETAALARAARDGALAPAALEGGTFSVSALGAFAVDAFTPIINPPNAGILGVGRLRDDVILVDGQVTAVPRLTLSLTWDHRVADGVPAAEFCRTIVELLGDPARLD
jgi:pyruvate dehydrogenase E2 component (dihydrolipoamide acetyltransferase)